MPMFDAQKLLGLALRDAVGGALGGGRRRKSRRASISGLPRGLEGQIGMGLIALAIAAFEHFRQPAAATPPLAARAPDPARAGMVSPPPPPPPAAGESSAADQLRSLHLLRAMIAAANADGAVDAKERQDMVARARESGLDDSDLAALDKELGSPLSLQQLILQTPDELRQQAFVAALIAIDVDNAAEHDFLAALADGLQIDAGEQSRLKQQLGLG
jgi:uncharacterized membrane protein YebE (DUF533 family)